MSFSVGFIDFIVVPTFTVLTDMTEKIVTPLIEEATSSGLAGFRRSESGSLLLQYRNRDNECSLRGTSQITAQAAIIAFLSVETQFTGSISVITANPIQSRSDTSVGSFRKRVNVSKCTAVSDLFNSV